MFDEVWMEVLYRPMAEGIADRVREIDKRSAIVVNTEIGTYRILIKSSEGPAKRKGL